MTSVDFSFTVLGCSATFPRPGNPCSGYLLRTGETAVWVDAGSGTFASLQQHVSLHDLTAVWVSHLHPDHCSDLLVAFNWIINTADAPRIAVYGPPGWATRIAAMIPSDEAVRLVRRAFDVHELHNAHNADMNGLRLRSFAVEHGVPAFGLRAEHGGKAVAYSGDTGPCPALIELALEADLFVCEAGATKLQRWHCTPSDAGRIAAAAGSHMLMLTHLAHMIGATRAVEEATQQAGLTSILATPGGCVSLDNGSDQANG